MDDVLNVSATPTVDTNIYASGDLIGTKMEFDVGQFRDAGGFILDSVTLVDQAKQSANVDLVLFNADPSGTTFTDNAAFDVADADMSKICAVVSLTTHVTFNDNSLSIARDQGIPIKLGKSLASQRLYGALVARATPTFAAATDVRVTLGVRAND